MKSKSSHILCHHLENISRKALEKYPKIIKDFVKNRHGIYALYWKNRLYYVGLARNLSRRLSHHLRDRHARTWDRFSVYLTIDEKYLHEIESLVLRIASPKGNRVSGKLINSENMKSDFNKKIKEFHRKERRLIFEPEKAKPSKAPKKTPTRKGRTPTLQKYVTKRFHIRMDYKGKRYIAHVRRDGTISFAAESAESARLKGKIYTSPSLAAVAVTGRPMNGWQCWKYERTRGVWKPIDELRK